MKKFTSFALCFIMVAMLLTGCRGKDPSETDSPTTGTSAATQAPTTATHPTTPAPTTGTSPSIGTTEGSDPSGTENNQRGNIMMPRAY